MKNRLGDASSPYLLQHAENPVEWFPWCDEAFDEARLKDKPVFLSIGYSACHWCHVMAHECFEDKEAADLLNKAFICIKVDREELPHIDHSYMQICQMMTGSGGWPLTIIMTPDKEPFFAATYLPKLTRSGITGIMELIPLIMDAWNTRRDKIRDIAARVSRAAGMNLPETGYTDEPKEGWLDATYNALASAFQDETGGFSTAPKFPSPHHLMFLLRYHHRTGQGNALYMVEKTLEAMRLGGIYDHVGSGFHRYATDTLWRVPHFEKMLYDQALLAMAYTEAYLATSRDLYRHTAAGIMEYVLRDMRSSDGLFISSEDADTEGEEGGYYLWTVPELKSLLEDPDFSLISRLFALDSRGNFPEGRKGAKNILFMQGSIEDIASSAGLTEKDLLEKTAPLTATLLAARKTRMTPHRDDKALTDWNGLMIAALAKAGMALDSKDLVSAAETATSIILSKLKDDCGRLLHVFRNGRALHRAWLDDYAFLIWGLIELHQATFNHDYLMEAERLTDECITLFWDKDNGGFFLTSSDTEVVLSRNKAYADNAIPSGNSVMLYNLARLSSITGDISLRDKALDISRSCSRQITEIPSAGTFLMAGIDFALGPCREIVLAGDPVGSETMEMISLLRSRFMPDSVIMLADPQRMKDESRPTHGKIPIRGRSTAYICRGSTCLEPVTGPVELRRALSAS